MKVVLFCGGLGTRLRDYGDNIPKPLVPIGYRPILWHVMKYYAHFGHKDFILCLGYRADKIKQYFLHYDECISNDFTMRNGGKEVELKRSDIQDWNITFVDTGLTTNIGGRLKRVEKLLRGEEMFLANYADGLTDYSLTGMVEEFSRTDKVGAFLCARPSQTFHVVSLGEGRAVRHIEHVRDAGILINAGFYVFKRQIFDFLHPGEDLVGGPFERLIDRGLLQGYPCDNFWAMDTFREQQELSDMYEQGNAPWELWRRGDTEFMVGASNYPTR
jgi:glucose-1-phosphate cytidylyltransferase